MSSIKSITVCLGGGGDDEELGNREFQYFLLLVPVKVFDPNLAHGKLSTSSHTISPSDFGVGNAIDQKPQTTWMPPQNTDTSEIVFDLLADAVISQFTATWRHPPKVYDLLGQDVVTLEYFLVIRFAAQKHIRALPYTQQYTKRLLVSLG